VDSELGRFNQNQKQDRRSTRVNKTYSFLEIFVEGAKWTTQQKINEGGQAGPRGVIWDSRLGRFNKAGK
jgi:hypothetical protein